MGSTAKTVNLTGDDFLSRATLPEDQDSGIGGRDEFDLTSHRLKRRSLSDQVAKHCRLLHFLAKILILLFEPLLQRVNLF